MVSNCLTTRLIFNYLKIVLFKSIDFKSLLGENYKNVYTPLENIYINIKK